MSTKYIASNWRLPNKAGVDSYLNDNYGLTFDGSEYIDLGTSVDLGTNSTISFWFKSSSGNPNNTIIGEDTYTFDYLLQIVSASNEANIRIGSTFKTYTGITEINDGNWNHWVIVRSGDSLELFINNTSKGIKTGYGTGTNTKFNKIGAEGDNQFPISGEISEVAVFNYALSSTQISTLYGSSSLGAGNPMALKPAPVAFYPLGDNSSGDPITQPNEAVEDASVFDFDGTNYIETSAIDLGLENTISFWAKSDGSYFNGMVWGGILQSNYFTVFLTNTNSIFYRVGGAANQFNNSDIVSALGSGNWFHCALVRNNGGADVACYINGDLKQTITGISGSSNNTIVQNIGARSIADLKINGELSNIAIWNSDQTSEISNIYNSGVPATTYTNTPTAWYKLDQSANWDVSGSGYWDVPDASGNGNDGISSGMTSANLVLTDLTRNLPFDSYSFSFDSASSDYIDCGSFSALNSGTAVTVSAWFKSSTYSNLGRVISNQAIEIYQSASLYSNTQGRFYYRLRGNFGNQFALLGGTSASGVGNLVDGNWHHLCVTFDNSTTTAVVYEDGVPVITNTSVSGTLNSASSNLYIGSSGTSTHFIDGSISNISLFNEALTSTEVMKLYSNGMPQDLTSFTPAPIAWWTLGSNSFFNGSNFICKDLIGSNDGTSVNAGVDALQGNTPRSEANGTGTNQSIPENLVGTTKYSSNNSWSINMSSTARVEDTP